MRWLPVRVRERELAEEDVVQVEEIMSKNLHACRAAETLDCAARMMWEHDVGSIPIVDDDGHVIGIVTDRDACMAAYTQGKRLDEIGVEAVMAKQIVTVRPTDSVDRAERAMRDAQVRRVPVVDAEQRLVGILSQNDLIRESVRARPGKNHEVPPEEVAATLAEIGRPRRSQANAPAQ